MPAEDVRGQGPNRARRRVQVLRERARFSAAPRPPLGLRDQKRALGEEAQVRGPPRGVPPTASPPLRLRESGRGLCCSLWGGGRSRGGAWRRADEMRAQPLGAAVLVLGALAGVGVGGERGSRWRDRRSQVIRSRHPAAAKCAEWERGKPAGGSRAAAHGASGARLGPSEPGAGGPSRPRGVRGMGYPGDGPPGRSLQPG